MKKVFIILLVLALLGCIGEALYSPEYHRPEVDLEVYEADILEGVNDIPDGYSPDILDGVNDVPTIPKCD